MNEDALAAYIARTKEAQDSLNRINEYLARGRSLRINPGNVTWDDVGDMAHVSELLREVVSFITWEDDHA